MIADHFADFFNEASFLFTMIQKLVVPFWGLFGRLKTGTHDMTPITTKSNRVFCRLWIHFFRNNTCMSSMSSCIPTIKDDSCRDWPNFEARLQRSHPRPLRRQTEARCNFQEEKEGAGSNRNYAKANKQNNNTSNSLEKFTPLERLT